MKSVNFKKITILFFSTAFLILIFSLIFLTKKKLYNAELLLNEVKTYFREVKGSYIVQEPIVLENINHNQPIYQGGITVLKNDHLINYEFYADAVSGQIIDIIEQLPILFETFMKFSFHSINTRSLFREFLLIFCHYIIFIIFIV